MEIMPGPDSGRTRKALIVTGEASGDLHGANLIKASQRIDPDLAFMGVGGSRMAEAGCDILIPGEDLAVMGLVEVVGHFPVILRAFNRLKRILHGPDRPDLLILIDFPEFNLRLAKQAKKVGVPVLYYVSPQIWAWRRGRAKKIARVVDRLAAIFPFEPEFYRGVNLQVEYVGNPLLDEAEVSCGREEFLARHGIDSSHPVVGLFPGSRRNEIRYNLETILASAERIRKGKMDVRFLLPVAPSLEARALEERIAATDLPVTLLRENIYDTAHACDAVVTVSGTVTLQVALAGTPMAILYKMAPLSFAVGRRLIRVTHIGLANIVAGEGVVREFIQDQATAENISAEILRIIDDREYNRTIRRGLDRVREKMGKPGCSERVARMASELSRGSVRKQAEKG